MRNCCDRGCDGEIFAAEEDEGVCGFLSSSVVTSAIPCWVSDTRPICQKKKASSFLYVVVTLLQNRNGVFQSSMQCNGGLKLEELRRAPLPVFFSLLLEIFFFLHVTHYTRPRFPSSYNRIPEWGKRRDLLSSLDKRGRRRPPECLNG